MNFDLGPTSSVPYGLDLGPASVAQALTENTTHPVAARCREALRLQNEGTVLLPGAGPSPDSRVGADTPDTNGLANAPTSSGVGLPTC